MQLAPPNSLKLLLLKSSLTFASNQKFRSSGLGGSGVGEGFGCQGVLVLIYPPDGLELLLLK